MKRKFTQEEVWQHMPGRIYYNPEDSNLFVCRRGSFSWTINLGNKWTWGILAAELLVIAMVLAFLL